MGEKERNRLLEIKNNRRKLADVPDETHRRSNLDRRGLEIIGSNYDDIEHIRKAHEKSLRYDVSYDVKVTYKINNKKENFIADGVDVSQLGILLKLDNKDNAERLQKANDITLKFEVVPGTLPEGLEMEFEIPSELKRVSVISDKEIYCGFQFKEDLGTHKMKRKGRYTIAISSVLLFLISLFIIFMRAESVIYFRFNRVLYLYSIMAAVFLLSRYLFAMFYKEIDIAPDYTPAVTIIIPCFNEEEWIERTIETCLNQNYPIDKLDVIVVDDASKDNSPQIIKETVENLHKEDLFNVKERLSYILMEENGGKRVALAKGIEQADTELLVFVDSDSFLDPFAIRSLVQPFKDPKMGGVAGRTEVANTYTNALTKMQSVRYYIAFRVMKAAESIFDTVSCLSGPLSAYRRDLLLENLDDWLNQTFLGQEATFGDDRSMTNFILKNNRTAYQDSAICHTIVPNDHKVFLKQQMRWKRSWLRESLIAARFMWKKEGFAALTFYLGVLVPILAPVVVLYNLVYVPLTYKVFPTTFLVGILMMALLMSISQLFLRRSTTWIFGLLFVLYYEGILLWQMPVAWITFWKSTWGTRMTPSDVEAQERREKLSEKRFWS